MDVLEEGPVPVGITALEDRSDVSSAAEVSNFAGECLALYEKHLSKIAACGENEEREKGVVRNTRIDLAESLDLFLRKKMEDLVGMMLVYQAVDMSVRQEVMTTTDEKNANYKIRLEPSSFEEVEELVAEQVRRTSKTVEEGTQGTTNLGKELVAGFVAAFRDYGFQRDLAYSGTPASPDDFAALRSVKPTTLFRNHFGNDLTETIYDVMSKDIIANGFRVRLDKLLLEKMKGKKG